MKKPTSFKSYIIAAAVFSIFATSPAYSIDWKQFSGAACSAYYGQFANDIHKGLFGAKNRSASPTWVSCPILRDNAHNNTGTRTLYVYIQQAAAVKTTCWARSVAPDGLTVQQVVNRTKTGPGWLWLDLNSSIRTGSYMVACKLPSNVSLSAVYWGEYPDTGTN